MDCLLGLAKATNTTSSEASVHVATKTVATIVCTLVTCIGCYSNGLIVYNAIQSRSKNGRKSMAATTDIDGLVISLSISDCIICLTTPPSMLFILYGYPQVPRNTCIALKYIGFTCMTLSLIKLNVIAMNRLARIMRRVRGTLSKRASFLIIGGSWLFSLAYSSAGMAYIWERDPNDTACMCSCFEDTSSLNPSDLLPGLIFITPLWAFTMVVFTVAYSTICVAVVRQNRMKRRRVADGTAVPPPVQQEAAPRGGSTSGGGASGADPEEPDPTTVVYAAAHLATERESKAITLCVLITVTAVLTWSPIIILNILQYRRRYSFVLHQLRILAAVSVAVNSMCNPFLYGQQNGYIKATTLRLLYSCYSCLSCKICTLHKPCRKNKVAPASSNLTPHANDNYKMRCPADGCKQVIGHFVPPGWSTDTGSVSCILVADKAVGPSTPMGHNRSSRSFPSLPTSRAARCGGERPHSDDQSCARQTKTILVMPAAISSCRLYSSRSKSSN